MLYWARLACCDYVSFHTWSRRTQLPIDPSCFTTPRIHLFLFPSSNPNMSTSGSSNSTPERVLRRADTNAIRTKAKKDPWAPIVLSLGESGAQLDAQKMKSNLFLRWWWYQGPV